MFFLGYNQGVVDGRELLKHLNLEIFMRSFLATSIVVATLLVSACGVRDNDDNKGSENSNLNLSPLEQLRGEWVGIYSAIENGRPHGEAAEATLKLEANGAFLLALNNNGSERVLGEWSEFQGRSLILKISGSTIPRVGSSGKIIEPTYLLLASSLRILNEQFELKLTKRQETPSEPPGENSPDTKVIGNWRCKSETGRTTNLVLSVNWNFSLTSIAPGERLFLASGVIRNPQGSILNLYPSNVTDPLPVGSYFQLTTNPERSQLLLRSDVEAQQSTSLGVCLQAEN